MHDHYRCDKNRNKVNELSLRIKISALALLAVLGNLPSAAFSDGVSPVLATPPYCGDTLLSFQPQPPADILSFNNVLDQISATNANYIEGLATRPLPGGLTDTQEKRLMGLIKSMPPYLASVHNSTTGAIPGDLLCSYLNADKIALFAHSNTPPVENALYSAHQCLFLSYGRKNGEFPTYGDVIFNFDADKLAHNGYFPWLAERSGTRILGRYRLGYEPDAVTKLSKMWGRVGDTVVLDREKEFYALHAYTLNDFQSYSMFNFITHLRLYDTKTQYDYYNNLIGLANDREKFYDEIDYRSKKNHAYVGFPAEVHVDQELPLNSLVSTAPPAKPMGISIDQKTEAAIKKLCPADYARYKAVISVR